MGTVHGLYEATPPTLTDGLAHGLQLDTNGNLKTVSAGTGATADKVQGSAASDTSNVGNPVKIGAVFNSSLPTFADTHTADVQMSNHGALFVTIKDGFNSMTGATSGTDATSNGVAGLWTYALPSRFNGTTWDRERGNFDTAALINAAAVTSTQTGADQTNYNGRGVKVVLDMTTVGTGSVTLTIQGKDAASGKYYTLLAGAAVITNSTNVYEVGPGLPATANVSANAQLPRVWRVLVTANNANATTYTVGASVIL